MSSAAGSQKILIETHSVDETLAVGRRIGAVLDRGDVLALIGPLGAGKTVLTKGIALGLGVRDAREVTSPTFVLMNVYAGRLTLHHFDAYRLKSANDMIQIGCEEAFYGGGVSVVEWADRVADCLPRDHVAVRIAVTADAERTIALSGTGERAERIIRGMDDPDR